MFQRSREEICRLIRESLSDNSTGKYSAGKIVLMLTSVAATVFMWKLIIAGGMSLDFFIAYLAFGSGHSNISKWLDKKTKE